MRRWIALVAAVGTAFLFALCVFRSRPSSPGHAPVARKAPSEAPAPVASSPPASPPPAAEEAARERVRRAPASTRTPASDPAPRASPGTAARASSDDGASPPASDSPPSGSPGTTAGPRPAEPAPPSSAGAGQPSVGEGQGWTGEPAAALSGAVCGHLRDDRGDAIRGAIVLALSSDGTDASETIADDDGFFLVAGLRPGRYVLFSGLGTPLAARMGSRAAEVTPGAVTRVDLSENGAGATVRVTPHDPDGHLAAAQAVLLAGPPREAGTFGSLLASDVIYFPRAGSWTVLPRVPPGVYTLVLLQAAGQPLRAARNPVQVTGAGEIQVDVEVAALAQP